MPLLTIITRTFNGRPLGLASNIASVQRQTRTDNVQHLIVEDKQRRGVAWAQQNLRTLSPLLQGDYVMLLDDDDFLIDDKFVEILEKVTADSPEVVIVKMNMGDGRILPHWMDWLLVGSRPEHSGIAASCFIVRRDVWNEHVNDFAAKYDGDFAFIEAVYRCGHPFAWWDRCVSRVGEISHGRAEDGSATPVGLPARSIA